MIRCASSLSGYYCVLCDAPRPLCNLWWWCFLDPPCLNLWWFQGGGGLRRSWLVPIDRLAFSRWHGWLTLLAHHKLFEPNHPTPQATTNTSATMSEEAENEQLTIRIKDGVSGAMAGGARLAGH